GGRPHGRRRRPGLRGVQARRGRPHAPARRGRRPARRHRERHLPGPDPDGAAGELDDDPRHRRAGDARRRRRRGRHQGGDAGRPPRYRGGDRGDGAVPGQRRGGLHHRTHARDRRRLDGAMIKRFHALYVGQIELENIGLGGTPANERRYDKDRLAEPFWSARDVAQLMDDLGYYALWTAEHHFQREGYECFPNLIQLSLWLATQTRRLKLGCAFNVLPMWHPVRLAEDYAMADIVTDGRVIMGVGRGYHSREVETFGAPLLDAEANREYFEEQLQLLLKCFNEEAFHHKGKYFECPPAVDYRGYRLKEITMVPRPKHLPVDVWMPIASGKTIDMMARYGLKAMVDLNGEKIL